VFTLKRLPLFHQRRKGVSRADRRELAATLEAETKEPTLIVLRRIEPQRNMRPLLCPLPATGPVRYRQRRQGMGTDRTTRNRSPSGLR
jgi:hypothetical protein